MVCVCVALKESLKRLKKFKIYGTNVYGKECIICLLPLEA